MMGISSELRSHGSVPTMSWPKLRTYPLYPCAPACEPENLAHRSFRGDHHLL